MSRVIIFVFLVALNQSILNAKTNEDNEETLQDLICEVSGFENLIAKGEVIKKPLPKESVNVFVRRSTEKFNRTKKEIYIRMHPLDGTIQKFDYLLIAGRFQQKTNDLYWDQSDNDTYAIKEIGMSLKSPQSMKYIIIDKLKGSIVVKQYNLNDNIHFKYIAGDCKPKELVRVIK